MYGESLELGTSGFMVYPEEPELALPGPPESLGIERDFGAREREVTASLQACRALPNGQSRCICLHL